MCTMASQKKKTTRIRGVNERRYEKSSCVAATLQEQAAATRVGGGAKEEARADPNSDPRAGLLQTWLARLL